MIVLNNRIGIDKKKRDRWGEPQVLSVMALVGINRGRLEGVGLGS